MPQLSSEAVAALTAGKTWQRAATKDRQAACKLIAQCIVDVHGMMQSRGQEWIIPSPICSRELIFLRSRGFLMNTFIRQMVTVADQKAHIW